MGQIFFVFTLGFFALASVCADSSVEEQRHCLAVISRLFDDSTFKTFSVDAYAEIRALQKQMPEKNLHEAAEVWLREGSSPLKAHFLMGQIGSDRGGGVEHYLKLIPRNERAAVWKKVGRETSFPLFRTLVQEKSRAVKGMFGHAALESFLFRREGFPTEREGGAKIFRMGDDRESDPRAKVVLTAPFEMQATPVTQLQWALVMGENPSRFTDRGRYVSINGKKMSIDPGRPVEQVSWNRIQRFIEKLNQLQSDYTYRLPTEAEWEYAARGGKETRYPFGNEKADLVHHAWFKKNSGGHTRTVALRPPNPFGLHDMFGNVAEMVADSTPGASGKNHFALGGSWMSSAWSIYPGSRYHSVVGENSISDRVGFRLVRVPRRP